MMTERERFVATLTFQKPDRIPFMPGHGRESTRRNWRQQGLPTDAKDPVMYVRQLLGLPAVQTRPQVPLGITLTMIPEFEEKIVEERPNSRVVQDWKGNVCEIGKEFDPSYLRGAPDFVTRSWIKCPVESRADWDDMKRRYDPDDPARFPADIAQRAPQWAQRDYVIGLTFSGPFWQLREWLGFENLCMLFLDDPDFAQEMIDFWRDYCARMLEKLFRHVTPDYVMVNEDMAYKEKPMIGPDMSRTHLLDCWRTWGQVCKKAGVPVYGVDSDGYIESLIPVWLEAGLHWNSPLEVAAGNDLPALRQRWGTRMAYSGGVDKRAMAKGGDVLKREMDRLAPAIAAGGYIPGCDHGVPSDVSWPNFVEYCRQLAQLTGWLK